MQLRSVAIALVLVLASLVVSPRAHAATVHLAPRSGTFDHWYQKRTLVSFDWTDL